MRVKFFLEYRGDAGQVYLTKVFDMPCPPQIGMNIWMGDPSIAAWEVKVQSVGWLMWDNSVEAELEPQRATDDHEYDLSYYLEEGWEPDPKLDADSLAKFLRHGRKALPKSPD